MYANSKKRINLALDFLLCLEKDFGLDFDTISGFYLDFGLDVRIGFKSFCSTLQASIVYMYPKYVHIFLQLGHAQLSKQKTCT